MYKIFRDIHLALGLFAAMFLMLYGVSALQLSVRTIFDRIAPTVATIEVPAERLGADIESPEKIRAWLRAKDLASGELGSVETSSTGLGFDVYRPGSWWKVSYRRGAPMLKIEQLESHWLIFGVELHDQSGIFHEEAGLQAWGWLVLVMSLATLLLAGSGLVLWFQRNKERRVGGIILVSSVVFTCALMVFIRL